MVFKEATFHGKPPEIELEFGHHASVERAVADALAMAGGIDASDVEVTAEGDTIVLTGTVGTAYEIERAMAVAYSVQGVRTVRNEILAGPDAAISH